MFKPRFILFLLTGFLLASCSDENQTQTESPDTSAPSQVNITEWEVPWPESRPRDPYAYSEEKVWFVGQRTGYLAYFNPQTEEFTQVPLPEGSGPHNIIVDDTGVAWYAGNLNGWIGKVEEDGTLSIIQMPNQEASDPHTLIEDGRGHIWFTVQGGNYIGRLNKMTERVDLIKVPTPGARPYGITVNKRGRPWVALFGTSKLATVDPNTLELREINLPREDARPRRIGITGDGNLWYVDYAGGFLGRYNPGTEEFKEWPMPGGENSRPYGMAVDNDNRIWFVETGPSPNRFVGFNPETETFFSITEIESGGGSVRHMMYFAPTNTVWFGTDANTLGRAKLP